MKHYILIVWTLLQMNTIVADQAFRQKFLNWKNSLTVSQKESIKDLISDYDRAYKMQDQDVLSHYQAAFENIMNHWNSLYKPLADAQTFHNSAKQYIKSHPKHKTVKEYLAAYNNFDQNPTDQKLHDKLVSAQKKLKDKITTN